MFRGKGARCLGLRERGVQGIGSKVFRVKGGGKVFRARGARCLGLRERGV